MQLAGNATCSVTVHFNPNQDAAGTVQARLLIAGTPGGTASITLKGTADTVASLGIDRSTASFGAQAVGVTSSPITFTVTNSGSLASGKVSVVLTGSPSADFKIVGDNCSNNMIPGNNATCTVGVTVTTSTMAQETATLTISGSPGGSVTAKLTATGVPPAALSLTPNPYDFKNVVQNTGTPPTKTFTVKNSGGVVSGVVSQQITGANKGDFTVTANNCRNMTLAPNNAASCTITVAFKPTTLTPETATLTATANPGSSASSTLNGTGVTQATLSIAPSGAFGLVNKGTHSTITFNVSNSGGVTSGVPMIGITGNPPGSADFKLTGMNTCTAAIPAGMTNACQFDVTFTPTTSSMESATLNLAATPGGTTMMLTGNGMPLKITPGSQNVTAAPGGMATTSMFTVTNPGTGPTGNLAIAFAPSSGPFTIATGDTCTGQSLDPMGGANPSCTFSVVYTPTGSLGGTDSTTLTVTESTTDKATATVTGHILNSGVSLALALSGPNPPPPVFTGSGSLAYTLTNFGDTASAAINMPTVSAMQSSPDDLDGDFSIGSNMCGSALGPGQSCTFNVVFAAPTMGGDSGAGNGSFSGTVKVADANAVNASANFTGSY
jgi:hypothetical protein